MERTRSPTYDSDRKRQSEAAQVFQHPDGPRVKRFRIAALDLSMPTISLCLPAVKFSARGGGDVVGFLRAKQGRSRPLSEVLQDKTKELKP